MGLHDAIANSLAWYEAILAAHGVWGTTTEHHWSCDAVVPPYHSNLVTRTSGAAGRAAQLSRCSELARLHDGRVWSLKDSHAGLPADALEALGLEILFEARWFEARWFEARWVEARASELSDARAAAPVSDLHSEPVRDEAMLRSWEQAWQRDSPTHGIEMFPAPLLDRPDLELRVARAGGRLRGGWAENRSGDSVGLSNWFSVEGLATAELLAFAARDLMARHPERRLVGYTAGAELRTLRALGCQVLGPLRVWITRRRRSL